MSICTCEGSLAAPRGTPYVSSGVRSCSRPPHGRDSVKACAASAAAACRFRPCIDIHKGKVKQIVGSSLQDLPHLRARAEQQLITNFESDLPAAFYANLYKNSQLYGGHVIMLGADEANRFSALGALMTFPGGLQLGGGITSDNAAQYLDAGASHVIVTSYVFHKGQFQEARLRELVRRVGKERLVLDLSCRLRDGKYHVVTDRWQLFSELTVDEQTLAELAENCDEFLVHGVDVEGKQLGVDEALVELLGRASPLPITYAGGVRSMADLERVAVAGRGRVNITVGTALDVFGGSLAFAEVLAWDRRHAQQGATLA